MRLEIDILENFFSEYKLEFRNSVIKKLKNKGLDYSKNETVVMDRNLYKNHGSNTYNGAIYFTDKEKFYKGCNDRMSFTFKEVEHEVYEITFNEIVKNQEHKNMYKVLIIEATNYNILYRKIIKELFLKGIANEFYKL